MKKQNILMKILFIMTTLKAINNILKDKHKI